MRVIFRTDSSVQIGSGHVMRCLTLANELRCRGIEILFICRQFTGTYVKEIQAAGHAVRMLSGSTDLLLSSSHSEAIWPIAMMERDAAETLDVLKDLDYAAVDWLIVDHYGLDKTWETLLRPVVNNIMVIDDLANRPHDCDVVLDQNYFGSRMVSRYDKLIPAHCRRLLGPQYALLQSAYAQLRKSLAPRDGIIKKVLIFFGGSDLTQQTKSVLHALSSPELSHLIVDIVLGNNYPDPEAILFLATLRPNTLVHRNLPSLAELMACADLFIGAGGATTWERLCFGLPSIVMSIAKNQEEMTQILAANHYQISLEGKVTSLEWKNIITEFIHCTKEVVAVSKNANDLVDGFGVKRLVRVMLGRAKLGLTMRKVTFEDKELLFAWANDYEARAQSFHTEVISADEHAQWFEKKLVDPHSLYLIAEDLSGLALGLVRFEMNESKTETVVSINVDKSFRGLGLSQTVLNLGIMHWQKLMPNMSLIAEIRFANERSERLFKKLGFTSIVPRRQGAQSFELRNSENGT